MDCGQGLGQQVGDGRAAEAVPDDNAKYNEAAIKFGNDKGAFGIITVGHGVENANVANASLGELKRWIADKALA
jgi:hypothetical protein